MGMNKILITVIVISALFLGLIFYGINSFYGLKKQEVCGALYRYSEVLPNGATVNYPMEKEYQDCIQSK